MPGISSDTLGRAIEVRQSLYVGRLQCMVLYFTGIFYGHGGKVSRAGFIGFN